MENPDNPSYYSYYNLILCRYNELGLKSPKVRTRMEYRLIEHIKAICRREKLSLQSALRLGGRLIFFFPKDKISEAITVFRYIIGLYSISPGFSSPHDLEVLSRNILNFANCYFQSGDSIAVRSKTLQPFPLKSMDLDRKLGGEIIDAFEEQMKSLRVDLTNPDKTLFVEVREKGAYIYTEKISTIWGGNPIESDKPMLANFSSDPRSLIACQLLIRRGTVISPIIFSMGKFSVKSSSISEETVIERIHSLAIFYPEPLSVIKINFEPILDYIFQNLSDSSEMNAINSCQRCIYAFFLIIDKITHRINTQKSIRFFGFPLWFKGVITTLSPENTAATQIAQHFPTVPFTPLAGLSNVMQQQLLNRIQTPTQLWDFENINQVDYNQEFSLADVILSNLNKSTQSNSSQESESLDSTRQICPLSTECNQKIDTNSFNNPINFDALADSFNGSDFQEILKNVIDEFEIISVEGRIL